MKSETIGPPLFVFVRKYEIVCVFLSDMITVMGLCRILPLFSFLDIIVAYHMIDSSLVVLLISRSPPLGTQ